MSDESLLQEVNEELRRDRMRALARQYGPFVIGAIVLIVLAVAANEGWRWYQKSVAADSSDKFYSANELALEGDVDGALAGLAALEESGTGGYPLLAQFRSASLLASEGRTEEALAAYDAIAASTSDSQLRDLALLLAGFAAVDGGDVQAVEQRVGGFEAVEHPFLNSAREAIGLAHYAAGDLDAAILKFQEMVDDTGLLSDARGRAQVYIAQLTAEGAVLPDSASADPAESTAAGDETAE